jgi:hypothetical protein
MNLTRRILARVPLLRLVMRAVSGPRPGRWTYGNADRTPRDPR